MSLQDFAVKPSTLEKLCLLRVFLSNNLPQEIKMGLGFYPADPLLPSFEPRALDHAGIQAKQHSKVERGGSAEMKGRSHLGILPPSDLWGQLFFV